jgi:hypothetical protein
VRSILRLTSDISAAQAPAPTFYLYNLDAARVKRMSEP